MVEGSLFLVVSILAIIGWILVALLLGRRF